MINKIFSFFLNSIKGRMMLNVAVIHAVIMGVIIYDLNSRQKEFMQNEQTKKGVELASILASNAADAMLRNDIVAMEELIFDVSNVKNADMVFLLDNNGRVRASNDKSYFNLVLNDGPSRELIDRAMQKTVNGAQIMHDHLVDTVYPISIRGETIGYARILLNNKQLESELSSFFHNTLVYALIAIIAGSFLAYLMIRQMSRDIDALSEAAKRISRKDFDTPVPTIKGKSEIANMAEALAVMAESIRQNIDELQKGRH